MSKNAFVATAMLHCNAQRHRNTIRLHGGSKDADDYGDDDDKDADDDGDDDDMDADDDGDDDDKDADDDDDDKR